MAGSNQGLAYGAVLSRSALHRDEKRDFAYLLGMGTWLKLSPCTGPEYSSWQVSCETVPQPSSSTAFVEEVPLPPTGPPLHEVLGGPFPIPVGSPYLSFLKVMC